MSEKIYFAKVKNEGIIPSKREEDGAFDVYACFEDDYLLLDPHETKLVPTGIASAFSADYVAVIKERGSTGTKGIGQRCGVIDSGYRGEWFIPITNHNDKPLVIAKEQAAKHFEQALVYPYEKAIAQCLMVVVPKLAIEEVSRVDLMKFESDRGTGALGSSGK
ncbi:MAG: dUTP pyrophosphatase [Turicibacter sp.]|nr:dUTP pyrophosphatase [Turicibacter sp.]